MRKCICSAAGLVAALAASGSAQSCGQWSMRSTGGGPPGREGAALAFDPVRGVCVLFGGGVGNPPSPTFSDTWEWNGTFWSPRSLSGPSARIYAQMVYDSSRNRMVLFGGRTAANVYSGETWEFDGSAWTLRAAVGPSARAAYSLSFDSARKRTVLFGGLNAVGAYLTETWEWEGTMWSARSTTGPSPRRYHASAFDPVRGLTLMFGGDAGAGGQADTWGWNGTTWMLISTPAAPIGRWGQAMSCDPVSGRTILFGGYRGGPVGDTWEFDGQTWRFRLSGGPGTRDHPSMTFDSLRGRFVLFGGYTTSGLYPADTWELARSETAVITHQPAGATAFEGEQATFSVLATSAITATYQWRHDGVNLVDGGRIAGATTPTLTINYVQTADSGTYDVVVSAGCDAQSSGAPLIVRCYANCDGSTGAPILNVNDFVCFLNKYAAGCP